MHTSAHCNGSAILVLLLNVYAGVVSCASGTTSGEFMHALGTQRSDAPKKL